MTFLLFSLAVGLNLMCWTRTAYALGEKLSTVPEE